MRVALFGLGGVAERIHIPACRALDDVDLVAACEPDAARRDMVASRFSIPRVYSEDRELLERERPELVIVGSPPDSHRELTLRALEAGAHVFCEKPFMPTVAEADEVIAAARRSRRGLRVNNQYRYMPIYRETQRRVARGDFGEPYFLQFWQQMFHPPTFETNWRAKLRRSTLYEFGTHALDLACFFFGALPEAVTANIPPTPHHVESDVLVQLTLRFPGGCLATFAANRVSHADTRYLETRLDCREASIRISLGGLARASLGWSPAARRPAARVSFFRGGESRVERAGRSRVVCREARPAFASATATHLREFVEEIRGGATGTGRAEHAREVLRVVFAGYEAARSGQTVYLGPPRQTP